VQPSKIPSIEEGQALLHVVVSMFFSNPTMKTSVRRHYGFEKKLCWEVREVTQLDFVE